jgi:hypothetical protein
MATVIRRAIGEPDETREDMEPSSMEPDDGRDFIYDLIRGMYSRVREMDADRFESPDNHPSPNTPTSERAKQFYGVECYQILSGIEAALDNWDESGQDVQELKEKYGGKFVEGVQIGERLAVYQGSDFRFTEGSNTDDSNEDTDNKFTFTGARNE